MNSSSCLRSRYTSARSGAELAFPFPHAANRQCAGEDHPTIAIDQASSLLHAPLRIFPEQPSIRPPLANALPRTKLACRLSLSNSDPLVYAGPATLGPASLCSGITDKGGAQPPVYFLMSLLFIAQIACPVVTGL